MTPLERADHSTQLKTSFGRFSCGLAHDDLTYISIQRPAKKSQHPRSILLTVYANDDDEVRSIIKALQKTLTSKTGSQDSFLRKLRNDVDKLLSLAKT